MAIFFFFFFMASGAPKHSAVLRYSPCRDLKSSQSGQGGSLLSNCTVCPKRFKAACRQDVSVRKRKESTCEKIQIPLGTLLQNRVQGG